MRSRAFNNFSETAKAIIIEFLENEDTDEVTELKKSAALSLVLIDEMQSKIKVLERKQSEAAEKGEVDIESGIITGVTITDETVEGERSGRPESLRISKIEKSIIRYEDGIERLQQAISRENTNFARTIERAGRLKVEQAKLQGNVSEMNPEAASLMLAIHDAITGNLNDLEDEPNSPKAL